MIRLHCEDVFYMYSTSHKILKCVFDIGILHLQLCTPRAFFLLVMVQKGMLSAELLLGFAVFTMESGHVSSYLGSGSYLLVDNFVSALPCHMHVPS